MIQQKECQQEERHSFINKNYKQKELTESTDDIIETTHITRAIFQWNTGVPHWNG